MIPFHDLSAAHARHGAAIERRIRNVHAHGRYVLGPEVEELETALARRVGRRHCISVGSGTDALLLALLACGIGRGDEVVMPAFCFVAAAEMTTLLGAVPVFVDIDPITYNLDPAAAAAAIDPRTRAIIAADLFGQCADYARLEALAVQRGLVLISDAAQSFGATQAGRCAGSFGTIAITSFYPTKPLGAYGDGGACFTDQDDLAALLRQLRNHGQQTHYTHIRVGINSRLDTMQAAVLLTKLEAYDDELARRRAVAESYSACFGGAVTTPQISPGNTSVWAQYTIEVEARESVRARLHCVGIPTAVHYPFPLHQQPAYLQSLHLPHSETATQRVLSLPFHADLASPMIERIAAAVIEATTAEQDLYRVESSVG